MSRQRPEGNCNYCTKIEWRREVEGDKDGTTQIIGRYRCRECGRLFVPAKEPQPTPFSAGRLRNEPELMGGGEQEERNE